MISSFVLTSIEAAGDTCGGRFQLLLDVAGRTRETLPDGVVLRVAASGPVTLAAKLVGMDIGHRCQPALLSYYK